MNGCTKANKNYPCSLTCRLELAGCVSSGIQRTERCPCTVDEGPSGCYCGANCTRHPRRKRHTAHGSTQTTALTSSVDSAEGCMGPLSVRWGAPRCPASEKRREQNVVTLWTSLLLLFYSNSVRFSRTSFIHMTINVFTKPPAFHC